MQPIKTCVLNLVVHFRQPFLIFPHRRGWDDEISERGAGLCAKHAANTSHQSYPCYGENLHKSKPFPERVNSKVGLNLPNGLRLNFSRLDRFDMQIIMVLTHHYAIRRGVRIRKDDFSSLFALLWFAVRRCPVSFVPDKSLLRALLVYSGTLLRVSLTGFVHLSNFAAS